MKYIQIILIKVMILMINRYNKPNKILFIQNKKYLLIQIQLQKYFNGFNHHYIKYTYHKLLRFMTKLYLSKSNISFREIHFNNLKSKLQITLSSKLILKRQLCIIVNQIQNHYTHIDQMTFVNLLPSLNNTYSKNNYQSNGHFHLQSKL